MVYAREFGWTPSQVDEIPLTVDPWLLPIHNILIEVENQKQIEAAKAAAEAKAKQARLQGG